MSGSYEFIVYLTRIKTAYGRFQTAIWVLNAAIISIGLYAFALLLGLPAFTKFYWQDFLPLALSPAILSVILGAIGATLIRRRSRSDLFGLLGPQLSEKARTACDNRDAKSLPMQKLAEELCAALDLKNVPVYNMPPAIVTHGGPGILGIEAGGLGIERGKHAARFAGGSLGVLQGCKTFVLQDEQGQIEMTHSVSAGLDYAAVGPEHALYHDTGRIEYTYAVDEEAMEAFDLLSRLEGIIPALESAHAIAYCLKLAPTLGKDRIVIVNLSGRGDKDVTQVAKSYFKDSNRTVGIFIPEPTPDRTTVPANDD